MDPVPRTGSTSVSRKKKSITGEFLAKRRFVRISLPELENLVNGNGIPQSRICVLTDVFVGRAMEMIYTRLFLYILTKQYSRAHHSRG